MSELIQGFLPLFNICQNQVSDNHPSHLTAITSSVLCIMNRRASIVGTGNRTWTIKLQDTT